MASGMKRLAAGDRQITRRLPLSADVASVLTGRICSGRSDEDKHADLCPPRFSPSSETFLRVGAAS